MKIKTRRFKINEKVRIAWPKQDLINFDLEGVQIIRRFNNDYDTHCYYVNSYRSLPLWLVKESDMRKVKGK